MEPPKINVFIIDDEMDIVKLYCSHFEYNGLNVVGMANNGFEALEKLKDSITKPDVIVIDYHMPEINGIETSKRILEFDNSFKIIMISGDRSIRKTALSNGIKDFFVKPHNITRLCRRIKEIAKKV
ncbi:MAG: response regulator [Promethearchaeota archaeon]